jgi:hypothetical protein
MKLVGHVAHIGNKGITYRILVGKRERKRPLGRPRCRRDNNIRMDLKEMGWKAVYWIHLA